MRRTKNRPTGINQMRARVEVLAVRNGWSLAEVARQMGIAPQTLQTVLTRGVLTDDMIDRLCAAFRVARKEIMRPVTAQEYGETMLPRF